ncbi:acyl-CoA N-acyltransferase [Mycena vulgaris]|nr:acyl-CoA N-acyltransferase [Mycena vulgaris]
MQTPPMADFTTPSSIVVVPRTTGGDIIVRQFQPKDAPQVHALLVEGLVYGPESPRNTALRRNLSSTLSCATYTGFALGLVCLSSTNYVFRFGGVALSFGAAALFFYVRRSITKMFIEYCATARNTDMADISASYEITPSVDGAKSLSAQGPGGFWVAAIESPENKTSEVVGYLGLDYHANADPTSGELRRMIVSMHHRRRRIGSLLITAVMDHARRLSPPLETLDLETSEFQPGARKLYENFGFTYVGTRVICGGALVSMKALRFRRKLTG